jgi:dolichol-phosphate mannosyltransferase
MPEDLSTTLERPAVAGPAGVVQPEGPPVSLRVRVRHGVRKPHNWFQLVRFGAVGATGYAVNLAVFALCVHGLGIDYRISAVVAWVVAVTNNFWWNRHWTFGAKAAHPLGQGIRFFAVSLATFGFSYAVLVLLVSGMGVTKVLAQAIAIAAGTPLNFVGQKLWSFKL